MTVSRYVPIEPPQTRWSLPAATSADEDGLVGVGADLEPGTLLAAYRSGLFPMPLARRGPVGWWSPDPRGIIPLDGLHMSRSLRRSCGRYEIRIDTVFADVVDGCADPRRPHGWITPEMRAAYVRLHELGWAHSIETWTPGGQLAGGLYGIAIGGFFAGESMFYRSRDSSKVALAALVAALRSDGVRGRLLDIQWTTPHLRGLGAIDVARDSYLATLATALKLPLPPAFS